MFSSKQCKGCEENKPLEQYGKDAKQSDGKYPYCKDCQRQRNRDYYHANKEALNKYQRDWRLNNPGRSAKRRREKYYPKYRDDLIAYQREYARKNPEKRSKIKSAYRARKLSGAFVVLDREFARIRRSSCAACGFSGPVEVDHVVPLSRGGLHCVGNLMPLCRSCNASKGNKLLVEWNRWRDRFSVGLFDSQGVFV